MADRKADRGAEGPILTTIEHQGTLENTNYRLQLKRGLFWTDIIQNCTKWSITGLHGLSYTSFDAKLRCASFLPQKNQEKSQYGPKKRKNVDFREKNL